MDATQPVACREAASSESAEIARLHVLAFPGFFLAALGPRFLARYYQDVIDYPGGICCVAEEAAGRLVGLVAGFVDPPAFYARLRADRVRLGLLALPALVRDPAKAARLAANYRRAGAAARLRPEEPTAELASLGVHPAFARRGIGERLVRRFVAEAGRRGAGTVTLTTDADGNDGVNRFYAKLGFTLARRFDAQPGRPLNEYSISAAR